MIAAARQECPAGDMRAGGEERCKVEDAARVRGASQAEAEAEATSLRPKRSSRLKVSSGSWERWQSAVLLQAGARTWMARRTAARAATPGPAAVPEALLSKPCALWPWSASSQQRSVAIGLLAVAGYHPSLLAAPLDVALRFAAARVAALAAHEAAHAAVALALGASVRLRIDTAARRPCTLVEGLATPCGHAAVRHAGWIASVALALLGWATVGLCSATTAAAWWTALDALSSDLAGIAPRGARPGAPSSAASAVFWCGNFGVLVLDTARVRKQQASALLQTMLRITSMRGAQSAGLATFSHGARGYAGRRARVVNGKRTDLPSLLLRRARGFFRDGWGEPLLQPPTLYQGHTRFATSSISSLDGTHPHQWTPAAMQRVWCFDARSGTYVSEQANVEAFITHNGDLDFFTIHGQTYAVGELRTLLGRLLHRAAPSTVDSACLAGLLELLRTRGHWLASVRCGYAYGGLRLAGNAAQLPEEQLWSRRTLEWVASLFEAEWCRLLSEAEVAAAAVTGGGAVIGVAGEVDDPDDVRGRGSCTSDGGNTTRSHADGGGGGGSRAHKLTDAICSLLEPAMVALLLRHTAALALPGDAAEQAGAVRSLVHESLLAFCNGDLLHAGRALLRGARGSFGLVLSHSLDAHSDFLVAARGQTMSVAFYPLQRLVLFGSEASACKAALNMPRGGKEDDVDLDASKTGEAFDPRTLDLKGATRLDLDDVNGEVVLVRWEQATEDWHLTQRVSQPRHSSGKGREGSVHRGLDASRSRASRTLQDALPSLDISRSRASRASRSSSASLRAPCSPGSSGHEQRTAQQEWLAQQECKTATTAAAAAPSAWLRVASDDPDLAFHEIFRYGDDDDRAPGSACRDPKDTKDSKDSKRLLVLTCIEGGQHKQPPLFKRLLRLDNNPLIQPLPKPAADNDPVGDDIADIPAVLRTQMRDWDDPVHSYNRMTAWAFASRLQARLGRTDGSVDLLITGCEVSLWLGEQFAADVHLAFPRLKVVTISANKLLGQLGQQFPVPQAGFLFHGESHSFRKSVVLLLTHSGGTFATLACANMLKAFTPDLFAVTSEWDTQVARTVREGLPGDRRKQNISFMSYVFVTFAGPRLAEPCSVSAVAMHQLLTQLLLHTMLYLKQPKAGADKQLASAHSGTGHAPFGATYLREEVHELAELNAGSVDALENIVRRGGALNTRLRRQGHHWAQHILEAPLSWLLSLAYIGATVIGGGTPLSAVLAAATEDGGGNEDDDTTPRWAAALVGVVDTLIYAFLPWWTTVLIRLLQRRPWLHRVAGRTLVVCDVPYVAQTLEAFASKLFALTYSITALSVYSGNPTDHMVHRHTHRVVRGTLLAVGRPDGRLNALTSAENTVCLSANQASSIQNYGVTAETLTIGHHPFKLPLSAEAIFLPTGRKLFVCEAELQEKSSFRNQESSREAPSVGGEEASEAPVRGGVAFGEGEQMRLRMEERAGPKVELPGAKKKPLSRRPSKDKMPNEQPRSRRSSHEKPSEATNANATIASLETLEGRERPKAADARGGSPIDAARRDSIYAGARMLGRIEPLDEPFIGAWMLSDPRFDGLTVGQLTRRQTLLQTLYETRVASLQRLVSFMVVLHAMGKRVEDFWRVASLGIFAYDCWRSQSRMRIATTASPVSGSEVRERTVQLADESSRQWAENHVTAAVRGHVSRWRIRSAERGRLARNGLGDGSRLPHQPAALNQLQQWQAQTQEQEQQRIDTDTAAAAAAAAAGSAVALAATTLAARLEDSAPPSMWTSSRSGLVKNNSNISELVASKSSEPGGSGEAEAFEASTAPRPRRRRFTFG